MWPETMVVTLLGNLSPKASICVRLPWLFNVKNSFLEISKVVYESKTTWAYLVSIYQTASQKHQLCFGL